MKAIQFSGRLGSGCAFVILLSLGARALAQVPTAAETREQKQHSRWVQESLSQLKEESSEEPPADILLSFAPRGQVSARERKNEKIQRDWLVKSLRRMRTIQPGATRTKLLKVFTSDGGVSDETHETFVFRTCPFIKVRVEFRLADRTHRRRRIGKGSENPLDVVTKISQPFLAYTVVDGAESNSEIHAYTWPEIRDGQQALVFANWDAGICSDHLADS
jgi:hypothetical protein